jgi:predicted nucleotidyltransferase
MVKILTEREMQIIDKKLKGTPLNQNESNILSKSIRPKLKEIKKIDAHSLLDKLEYNRKVKGIEKTIRKIILKNLKNLKALILYGSAIQTNYNKYNDIDLMIITEKKTWKNLGEKYRTIIKLKELAKEKGLNLDIQIIDEKDFHVAFIHSPTLIYQLKDSKVIYGKIKIPSKRELSKLDLRIKLDWSDIDDADSEGKEIYQSLRNLMLVKLLLKKMVDNRILDETTSGELGYEIISKLKNNSASRQEKKLVINYIKETSEKTNKEIQEATWEKIEF